MQDEDIEFDDERTAEIDGLMREATRIVCGTRDFAAGLARFIEILPDLAPQLALATAANDAESRRALCSVLFREVWNHVPRPDNGFRPLIMPRQERNNPCQCGSGKKYKQCCGRFEGAAPFDAQGLSLLKYVLEDIPETSYATLPFRHLSAEELAFVADQWLQEGRPDKAVLLLAPLLADVHKLDARHEPAFDLLGDAYMDLGLPQEREALVERMMNAKDATLKCAALHRRCTMLSDAGRWPEAWQLFAQAQRLQPDNPALSHLEVIMLASEGRLEQAKARAQFWLTRLTRQGQVETDDPLAEFLRRMSVDPDQALAMMRGEMEEDDTFGASDEWAFALIDLLEDLPEPQCHYTLQPRDGNAGELKADRKLGALENQWREVFPQDSEDMDGFSPWEDTEWLDWLAANPAAWQSFRIVEDVVAVIDGAELYSDDADDDLAEAEKGLLAHAARLLEDVIVRNKAQGCLLEWGWLENRPALRLLAGRIDRIDDDEEERLRLLEWLVGTLNPNDNQGLRETLARDLIARGRAADALALCERYPGDGLGAMIYARVLALQQIGQFDRATAALAEARKERPRILKTLLAAKPRMPDLDYMGVTMGGEDEAWYYRMDWLPLWRESGALAWLKQAAKGVK
ncbi:MAG: SEC-C metal-binding domain-containing protein [Betaproteobacteria bacterium]|nr:SEC-C metal-binding domain-containing protein [Betaproteobacteria bacterium]